MLERSVRLSFESHAVVRPTIADKGPGLSGRGAMSEAALQSGAPPVPEGRPSGSPVRSWSAREIDGVCQSPEMLRLFQRWRDTAQTTLPRLNELIGADHRALDNAMLLVRQPDDLVFVHHGAGALRTMGRSLLGVLHSEVPGAVARAIEPLYWGAIAASEPFYLRYVSRYSERHVNLEQLVLPLADDATRVANMLLVACMPMDDKSDMLKAIFDHSQVGMVAAMQEKSVDSKTLDGRILMINAQARRILKLPENMDRVNMVSDLGPWFRDGALWTRTEVISEGRLTHLHYRDRATELSYRVTVEPIERFVLFSIIELGKLA